MSPPARIPLLAIALAAVAMAGAFGGGRVVGAETVDAQGSWWFQWWVARSLAEGESLAHTSLLFFPWGKDVLAHTGANLLDAALVAPIRWVLGPVAAWNALAVLALATNGMAAGWWALRRGGSALGATALLTLHPFALEELAAGRPTQAILAPALLAMAWADDPREGRSGIFWSGVWLAVAGWMYWYAALFAGLGIGLLLIGGRWRRAVAILAVAFVGVAPVAAPLLWALGEGSVVGLITLDDLRAGVATTVEGTPVRIAVIDALGNLRSTGGETEGVVLGLVGFIAVLASPGRWRWVGGLGLALALGPVAFGIQNPVYLGAAWLLPPFLRLYWPVRAVLLCAVAAVPAMRGRVGAALGAAAVVEALVRGWAPLPVWTPSAPDAYACLGEQGSGAVITLPHGSDQRGLVYQTVHGLPLLGGMNERSHSLVPEESAALRRDNGWLAALLLSTANPRSEATWSAGDREELATLGFRWVAYREDAVVASDARLGVPSRRSAVRRRLAELAGEPVYEAGGTLIYAPWGGWQECTSAQ